jgi:imidazole glycerol phosphate synthase glutamine amidotransferase subunit
LQRRDLFEPIKKWALEGKPLLGICLGMQLLFTESEEAPGVNGLDIYPGRVVRFSSKLKVPQVGWNRLEMKKDSPLFSGLEKGQFAYFVHSYYVVPEQDDLIVLESNYGVDFPAAIGERNCWGVQFHPEKSGKTGLKILSNFGGMYDEGNSGD